MNAKDMWGRDTEIEHNREALADVAAGNGRIILYEGEAGIGKTRLIAEVSRIAKARDFLVFNGRCFDEEGVPSFWPWIEILREFGRTSGWDEVEKVFRDDRDFLLSILPELKKRDDEGSETDSRSIQSSSDSTFVKAYDFYRVIESAASRSPIVIVLDDLQWADEQSVAVLRIVARNIESVKVLVLLAYRTETANNNERIGETIVELYRLPLFQRYTLEGLSSEDVKECVSSLAGKPVDDEASKLLQKATGGNALLTVSVAHAFFESTNLSEITAQSIDGLEVPKNVSAIVQNRIGRFPSECRNFIELAAVIGLEFSIQNLIGIEDGWNTSRVVTHANEAVSGRIIDHISEKEGWFRFSHDLVRRAIIDGITPAQRMHHHAVIAKRMEETTSIERSEKAAELLRHHLAAGVLSPVERAAELALHAGLHAMKSGVIGQAINYFKKGLEMADENSGTETIACLNLHLGQLYIRKQDSTEKIRVHLDRACTLFGKTANQTGLLKLVMIRELYYEAHFGGMKSLFIRCLSMVNEDSETALYAKALIHIAELHESKEDRLVEDRINELIDTARDRGLVDLITRVYHSLDIFHHAQGRFDKCIEDNKRILNLLAKQDRVDPEMYVYAVCEYADALERTNRNQQAQDELEKLSHYSELKTRPDLLYRVRMQQRPLGKEAFLDVAKKREDLYELMKLGERIGVEPQRYLGSRLGNAFHNGLEDELAEVLDSIRGSVDQGFDTGIVIGRLTKYILLSGDCSTIPSLRLSCTRLLGSQGMISKGRFVHHWNVGLATCALCEGNSVEATKLYTSLRVEQMDSGHLDMGLIAWKLGNLDDAVEHLEAALEYPSVYSIWADLKLGEVLLERDEPGDRDTALSHIHKAQEIALENHIVPIAKQAEAILLSLEGKHPPKAARFPANLTPREVDVLVQIAAGKTGKEIATELFISPSTVSNHIGNIFRKTGTGNRTEAVLFAVKNGIAADTRASEEHQ